MGLAPLHHLHSCHSLEGGICQVALSVACVYETLAHWFLLQNVELIASLQEVQALANQSPADSGQGNMAENHDSSHVVKRAMQCTSPQVIYVCVVMTAPV